MPLTALRSLALTVDEPKPGEYFWSILERFAEEEHFELLIAADEPARHYGEALKLGTAMLTGLADGNLKMGPRTHLEDLPLFVETARPGLYDLLDD